jgi:hypothetical protein
MPARAFRRGFVSRDLVNSRKKAQKAQRKEEGKISRKAAKAQRGAVKSRLRLGHVFKKQYFPEAFDLLPKKRHRLPGA